MSLVRQGSIAVAWHEPSRRLQAHAQAFDSLETHSRILPLVLVPALSKEYPETHVPCWAVVTHRVLVPTLVAYRDQQPLPLHALARLPGIKSGQGWKCNEAKVRDFYDFVWIYNPGNVTIGMPSSFDMVFAAEGCGVCTERELSAFAPPSEATYAWSRVAAGMPTALLIDGSSPRQPRERKP